MKLLKTDLTQRIHKESMLRKVRADENNINLLLEWSMLKEQPLGWRAIWILKQVLKKNDPRLLPHIDKVLDHFTTFNESQKREWLKTLEHQLINEDQEGLLFDLCVTEWKKIQNHPALRASSIQVIFKLLKKYPELKDELNHLMGAEYLETLSPGIRRIILRNWANY